MSIQAVVSRRDLAVREPAPVLMSDPAGSERLVRATECARGRFVPVQGSCVVAPEVFRVVEGVGLDAVLRV
jgi:hypothetical protein